MAAGIADRQWTVFIMSDLWRSLNVEDKVRVVAWPQELHRDKLHNETCEFYEWLIATNAVLTIVRIDDCGLPWGKLRRIVDGVEGWESVALNHGGLELVATEETI